MGKKRLTPEEKLDRKNARRNVFPLLPPKVINKNYIPEVPTGPTEWIF